MKVSEPPTLKLNAAWYKERRGFNSLITIRQTNNIDSIMMPWDHQHTHTCMLRKNRQLLNFIMISVRIITQYRCSRFKYWYMNVKWYQNMKWRLLRVVSCFDNWDVDNACFLVVLSEIDKNHIISSKCKSRKWKFNDNMSWIWYIYYTYVLELLTGIITRPSGKATRSITWYIICFQIVKINYNMCY